MDINLLREAVTVLSFLGFMGIVAYAVSPNNRRGFEDAARVPFDDELPPPQPSPKGEGASAGDGFAKLEQR
jgi:cytochrome c oxidase cbb3-type subunit 4